MLISLMVATLIAAPQTGESVEGKWKTETRNAIVEIARCGPSICGRILTSDALRTNPDLRDTHNSNRQLQQRPLRGLQILSGFKPSGNNWTDGRIYNAEDGKTYTADITLVGPDQLKLRGCVFKPFCRTQTWTRVR